MPPRRVWEARHLEVLERWPVLAEDWARKLEAHRLAGAAPATPAGAPRDEGRAITPREAIDRALGANRTAHDEVGLLPGG